MAAHEAMHALVEGERPARPDYQPEHDEERDEQRNEAKLEDGCPPRAPRYGGFTAPDTSFTFCRCGNVSRLPVPSDPARADRAAAPQKDSAAYQGANAMSVTHEQDTASGTRGAPSRSH